MSKLGVDVPPQIILDEPEGWTEKAEERVYNALGHQMTSIGSPLYLRTRAENLACLAMQASFRLS